MYQLKINEINSGVILSLAHMFSLLLVDWKVSRKWFGRRGRSCSSDLTPPDYKQGLYEAPKKKRGYHPSIIGHTELDIELFQYVPVLRLCNVPIWKFQRKPIFLNISFSCSLTANFISSFSRAVDNMITGGIYKTLADFCLTLYFAMSFE